nr:hypothetical protein [uncultured Duganella sp.]
MSDNDRTAHPQGDFFNADRFHNDLQNFSKQIAGCDKLVRMANISLNQIDARIAEAAKIEAKAAAIVDQTAKEAGRVAAEAASVAVAEMMGKMAAVTREAEQVVQAINRSRGQTGLWIAFYVACTLVMCLLTAWITQRIAKSSAITPEMTESIALGDKHEALLRKATDKERKLINEIIARKPKAK